MIHPDDIEKAVDYLRDSAVAAAQARANHEHLDDWIKVVLAQEMQKCADLPLGAQDREAKASAAYRDALLAKKQASESDYTHRFYREAAAAKIEAFRTLEATRRAEGKAYA